MRNFFYLVLIVCTYCNCSYKPSFKTPNDVTETQATVYMNNGTVLKGLLSVYFENDMADGQIYLMPQDSRVKQLLKVKDIASYVIGSNTYLPKGIDLYMMGTYHFLFVKQLTNDTDRMQLYELPQLYKSNVTGEETVYYFFSFPYFSKYEVVDINSSKILPDFDFKMSRYVQDCPELAGKIQNKEKSFYYNSLALRSKREEVIKNIVKAYNECK